MAGVHVAQSGMSDTGDQPPSKVVWARDAALPEPVIAGLRKFRSAKQKVSIAMTVATAPLAHHTPVTAKMLEESLGDRAARYEAFKGIPFAIG